MKAKGAFTRIALVEGKCKVIQRRVLYEDGQDAWRCFFGNFGETEKRSGDPTKYAFTYDQNKGVIYMSEGYRDQERKDLVRARTLGVFQHDAGAILTEGIDLTWLTDEEKAQVKAEYQETVAKGAGEPPFGGDTGTDADTTPEPVEGTREDEGEIRYRCGDCGRRIPVGRKSCRKCGSKNLVRA